MKYERNAYDADSADQMEDRLKKSTNTVMFMNKFSAFKLIYESCHLIISKDELFSSRLAFPVNKGFKFKDYFNQR